jgi:hypothetical protein
MSELQNKAIAPFCTHGGSGTVQSLNDIRSVCPNSTCAACGNHEDCRCS